ncbi:MAG: hypothetical protein LBK26_03585 [Rickettsiales bacterium]|jgi:hypothetical protein|nr:hypothetical protein [Rickettsiales bacterium]
MSKNIDNKVSEWTVVNAEYSHEIKNRMGREIYNSVKLTLKQGDKNIVAHKNNRSTFYQEGDVVECYKTWLGNWKILRDVSIKCQGMAA